MAKELPYFQFEPAEYLTKDVSFCSLEAQGLFINICAYYWQRNCELTKGQVLRRLNYESALNELIKEGVIDLQGEDISIKFLDSQRENAISLSAINSAKGKMGGRPKKAKQKPTESRTKAEVKPNESHKIKEDKIKKDNKNNNANKLAEGVIEYFNGVCVNLPKVIKATDKRKMLVTNRMKEYSKDDLKKAIDLTAESAFLNGDNDRGWTANFDWMMEKRNFIKILEQTYKNKTNGKTKRNITREQFEQSIDKHFQD